MHKTWLIARREFLERVRTKAFIVSTVLIPMLMGGFVFGTYYMDKKEGSATSHVTLVASDTQLALDLQKELDASKDAKLIVDVISPPAPDTRKTLNDELEDKSLDSYLWITPPTAPGGTPAADYNSRSTRPNTARTTVETALQNVLMRRQLARSGMANGNLSELMQPIKVVQKKHAPKSSIVVAYLLFFLMYMVVMLYGMNVARSIIEEKTSRVFEVLLATIRPEEMMAGKIIGVGGVGLAQIAIWMLAVGLISASSIGSTLTGGDLAIAITPVQILFFMLYFVFGFLLYSSMAAALGAMTNSEQELQQLNMFLVMPLAVCFIALRSVLANPDSTAARVLALIPPFTPLIMYLRVSLGHPARWEVVLSIVLLSASIYGIIWVTSRIYRIGVLMYGKRPNLPEILRWLKYS
jgi:ABC-2 type transport system permease protein